MKTICLLLFAFIFASAKGQKFKKDVDKFTGNVTYYTDFETVFRSLGAGQAGEKVEFSYFKIKDSLFLTLSIRLGGSRFISVNANDKIYLKPSSGETILLSSVVETTSQYERYMNGSTLTCMYYLSPENINRLKVSDIEAMRIEYGSSRLEYDIKSKFSTMFKKVLNN